MIPFNKPYLTGKETAYIVDAVNSGKISGDGMYTKKCQSFFEEKYGFKKCLLTTSCTDALEMASLLCNIQTDDEVIMPSYTFVSTALPFIRLGAKILFIDSQADHPNMDVESIEPLITSKTKVIVPVHYAGVACDMDKIMKIAHEYNLVVIEDCAHSIDAFFISSETGKMKALGSIGHMGAFSFHETKNIISGEGGMITINDNRFIQRSEIIWEKGTNRAQFFRGEVNKYGWVDIGSSFLPSEITAAFLKAQIEQLQEIQNKRKKIWMHYFRKLKPLADVGYFSLPHLPDFATNNGHLFYLICHSLEERTDLISHLRQNDILAVFHYQSLHKSDYYCNKHDGRPLPYCENYSDTLIRLPLFYELEIESVNKIIDSITNFFKK